MFLQRPSEFAIHDLLRRQTVPRIGHEAFRLKRAFVLKRNLESVS